MQPYRPILIGLAACLSAFVGCHQMRPAPTAPTPAITRTTDALDALDAGPPKAADPIPAPVASPVAFSTVLSPDLPQQSITLAECIALALENGRTGDFYDSIGGRQRTAVTGLKGQTQPANATDSIRVLAFDPAIAGSDIEAANSRFDAWSETNLFWNHIDQPTRLLFSPDPFQQLTTRNKLDDVNFQSGIYQLLQSGGFAGMRLRTDYENNVLTPNSQILNPAYRPAVDFLFEQPLLQGAGALINQLRDTHPGSYRQNAPAFVRTPGIMLVRLTHQQAQLEFERQIHELVYRVEEAYWQLYAAYWNLYSSDNGLKQTHAAWEIAKARFDAGGIGVEDLALVEEQYQFFRNERLQALGRGTPGRPGVLEAERQLRYVIGLPAEDGVRLVPLDRPTFAPIEPELSARVAGALHRRPELRQVAQEIQAAQFNLRKAEDLLKPDLRFVGRYDINQLADNLGPAIGNLASQPHHEWEVGARLVFPLGFRGGNAETARAKYQLSQRLMFLNDQKEKLLFSMQRSYRDVVQFREQYQVRQSQRVVAAKQLKARSDKFRAGGDPKNPSSALDLLLRSQRNWVDTLREEQIALTNYRTAVVNFEREKGTILDYANVSISEGALSAAMVPNASGYLKKCQDRVAKGTALDDPAYDVDPVRMTGNPPPAVEAPRPTLGPLVGADEPAQR